MQAQAEIYADFYGLRGRPFHITADPRSLFLSEGHKEALAAIVHGVRSGKGFIVVTGEVGVGKTTVLRAALEHLEADHVKVIYIPYPQITVEDLLRQIGESLGERRDGAIDVVRLLELLIEHYKQGTPVVVVIDEAQRVAVEVLESLRLLSNFETEDDKLVQTVLLGQPELESLLARHDMRQFRSRVAFWVRIGALSTRDSHAYIAHRLSQVGGESHKLFSRAALDLIVKQARGFPRSLNIYCDNALVTAFGSQAKIVTRAIAQEALAGFGEVRKRRVRHPFLFGTSLACGFAATAIAAFTLMPDHDDWLAAGASHAPMMVAPAVSDAAAPPAGATPPDEDQAMLPTAAISPASATTMPAAAALPHPAATPATQLPPESSDEQFAGTVAPPPYEAAAAAGATRIVVRSGDTLESLATRVYGRSSKEIISTITRRNKGVTNPSHLLVGQELVFPALGATAGYSDATATASSASRTHRSSP